MQRAESNFEAVGLSKLFDDVQKIYSADCYDVPFYVSSLCNLGPDTLRKPRDNIAWVSATLHDWLKVLLAEIASDYKFDRFLGRMPSCCFSLS